MIRNADAFNKRFALSPPTDRFGRRFIDFDRYNAFYRFIGMRSDKMCSARPADESKIVSPSLARSRNHQIDIVIIIAGKQWPAELMNQGKRSICGESESFNNVVHSVGSAQRDNDANSIRRIDVKFVANWLSDAAGCLLTSSAGGRSLLRCRGTQDSRTGRKWQRKLRNLPGMIKRKWS